MKTRHVLLLAALVVLAPHMPYTVAVLIAGACGVAAVLAFLLLEVKE